MKPLHYTLVLILLLLTYYHGGFCLQSDSSDPSRGDTEKRDGNKGGSTSVQSHSEDGVKELASNGKKVPQVAEEGHESTASKKGDHPKETVTENEKDKVSKHQSPPLPSDSGKPGDPSQHVQDNMEHHIPGTHEMGKDGQVPQQACTEINGVPCDDVKKVISPELPKLSQQVDQVPPEAPPVKVSPGEGQQEEKKDKPAKTESIDEPKSEQNAEAKSEDAASQPESEEPPPKEEGAVPESENGTILVEEEVKKEAELDTGDKKDATSTDGEAVTPPINVIVPQHEEEDLPSFNEWKQTEAKKEEEKIKQNGQPSQPGVSGSQLTRPNTMRTNYGSLSCGAKVLAHNPEVQHASYPLNDNKDEYMINPCSANKWFIVELCEPIQVKFIEVANYELFSSLPKDIRFHASDKYPTKDWKLLNTYTATEERKIHLFPVIGQQLYSKYLKVEVLSHFGTEHFCPITLLRIFGTSYAELDDDDVAGHNEEVTSSDDHHQTPDGATNIFTSATDIVMNVVKKVLKGSDDTAKPLDAPSIGKKENKSDPCSSRQYHPTGKDEGNVTEDYDLPCTQDGADTQPNQGQIKPDVPGAWTGQNSVSKGVNMTSDLRPSVPYPTIPHPVIDDISRAVAVVSVINYYGAMFGAMYRLLSNCYICETAQSKVRTFAPFIGHTSCIYMCILTKCWQKTGCCCHNCHRGKKFSMVPRNEQIDVHSPILMSSLSATIQPSILAGTMSDGAEEFEKPTSRMLQQDSTSKSVHIPLTTPETRQDGATIQQTKTLKNTGHVIGTAQTFTTRTVKIVHQNTQTLPGMSIMSSAETLKHSPSVEPTQSIPSLSASLSSSMMGPEVIHGSDVTKEPVVESQMSAQTQSVSETVPQKEEEMPAQVPEQNGKNGVPSEVQNGNGAHQNGNGNGNGVLKEDVTEPVQNGKDGAQKDNGNSDQLVPDLPVAGAASAGKRESAIMRLNNRVKALELNMSLSSRYLEELSQRYKKQMDAMARSFNITIARLMNTSKWAEQSDQRQKEKMYKLQARIEELTQVVNSLTQGMDKMHVRALENHLILFVIETMVVVLLFLMCSRRNRQRATQAELQELLSKMPEHPKVLQRHNSDPAIATINKPTVTKSRSLGDVDPKITGSDGNLFIIEPTNFPFLTEKQDVLWRYVSHADILCTSCTSRSRPVDNGRLKESAWRNTEKSKRPMGHFNLDLSESKKKKRKKSKKLQRVVSTSQISPKAKRDASNTTLPSAGLLFGSSAVKDIKCESVNGVRVRQLSRSSSMGHIDVTFDNSSSSCTVSSQSTEGFKFENMTSNEAAKKRSKKVPPKLSPTNIGPGALQRVDSNQDRRTRPLRELPVASAPPFQKKFGKKWSDDGATRHFNGSGRRSVNSLPYMYEDRYDLVYFPNPGRKSDLIETYSDGGKKKFAKRQTDQYETHSDSGRFQKPEPLDGYPHKVKKKKSDFGGKKKGLDSRQFDGQAGPAQGHGKRGGYKGRRNDMDGLGSFKTWVSYRH